MQIELNDQQQKTFSQRLKLASTLANPKQVQSYCVESTGLGLGPLLKFANDDVKYDFSSNIQTQIFGHSLPFKVKLDCFFEQGHLSESQKQELYQSLQESVFQRFGFYLEFDKNTSSKNITLSRQGFLTQLKLDESYSQRLEVGFKATPTIPKYNQSLKESLYLFSLIRYCQDSVVFKPGFGIQKIAKKVQELAQEYQLELYDDFTIDMQKAKTGELIEELNRRGIYLDNVDQNIYFPLSLSELELENICEIFTLTFKEFNVRS